MRYLNRRHFFRLLILPTAIALLVGILAINPEKLRWKALASKLPIELSDSEIEQLYGENEGPVRLREYYWHQRRAYPLDEIPPGARMKALDQLEQRFAARGQTAFPWKALGPVSLRDGQMLGTFGSNGTAQTGKRDFAAGRTTTVAYDPKNPDTIYAGCAQGGFWRSTDKGKNWTPLLDDQPSLAVGSFAIDPNDSQTIYVGTGESNGSADSYAGVGILKTTDGGGSWRVVGGEAFLNRGINRLLINASDTKMLLAISGTALLSANGELPPQAGGRGVWRSTDAGETWTRTLATAQEFSFRDLSAAPDFSYVIAAGVEGVFQSEDKGVTWKLLTDGRNGLPASGFGRVGCAVSPSSPKTAYLSFSIGSQVDRFFATRNGGGTWTQTGRPEPAQVGGQLGYDHHFRVHPTNPQILYFGGVPLFRSGDGGATWTNLGGDIHADQHGFAFNPQNPREVLIGNDGGVYLSRDEGQSWTSLNQGLNTLQFVGIAVSAQDPGVIVGGTQDNGTQLFVGSPTWEHVSDGDGGYCAVDPSNKQVHYSTRFNVPGLYQILRSTTGGRLGSYQFIGGSGNQLNGFEPSDRVAFYAPVEVDQNSPGTVYYGTMRLYKFDGSTWTPTSPDLTRNDQNGGVISTIATVKGAKKKVLVGTSDGLVRLSLKGGKKFTNVSNGLPNRFVSEVAIAPDTFTTLYAAFSGFGTGHVFRSTNDGQSWTDISANLPDIPVNALEIDPASPSIVYVGTDIGVFRLDNGTWTYLTGLPRSAVTQIVINTSPHVMRVSTYGRGIWELPL